jgi:hypothetical protein
MTNAGVTEWRRWLSEDGRRKTKADRLRRLTRMAEAHPALDLEADLAAAYLHCGIEPYPDNRDWKKFRKLVEARLRPRVRTEVERLFAIRAQERSGDYDSISGPLGDAELLEKLPAVPGFDVEAFCQASLLWSGRLSEFCLRHARPSQAEYCRPHLARDTHGWSLSLRGLPLGRFPESADDFLAELEAMDLNLPLQTLSEHMAACTRLRRLRLENMEIRSLPEALLGLAQLRTVVFWGCSGPRVPELIWRLPQLESLEIESCFFERDPPDLTADGFRALREYGFTCKGLRQMGDEITLLDGLETLRLYAADDTRMPGNIGLLARLRRLTLLGPMTGRGLPDTLTMLSGLRELSIRDWRDPALAVVLSRMRQLKRLSVRCAHGISAGEIQRLERALPQAEILVTRAT